MKFLQSSEWFSKEAIQDLEKAANLRVEKIAQNLVTSLAVVVSSRRRQVTDLDVTVLGFFGPRIAFCATGALWGRATPFFYHFNVHLNSVLGRTELCHEVWTPGPQKPQIISNENHHLALLDSLALKSGKACDNNISQGHSGTKPRTWVGHGVMELRAREMGETKKEKSDPNTRLCRYLLIWDWGVAFRFPTEDCSTPQIFAGNGRKPPILAETCFSQLPSLISQLGNSRNHFYLNFGDVNFFGALFLPSEVPCQATGSQTNLEHPKHQKRTQPQEKTFSEKFCFKISQQKFRPNYFQIKSSQFQSKMFLEVILT